MQPTSSCYGGPYRRGRNKPIICETFCETQAASDPRTYSLRSQDKPLARSAGDPKWTVTSERTEVFTSPVTGAGSDGTDPVRSLSQ